MTPDQHAARAEQLAAAADDIYQALADGRAEGAAYADPQLTATIALARLHAALAMRPSRGWPPHGPSTEVVDYGDGFP
ncbi:hypothetical protein AB0F81_21215 [Actinoplanes sp. NPDC024001]|uniref:hypothetical protein n=1 Tax=Actinoplanes sp. NPDC024001 TaxID=3154598 RepID=UPI0033EFFD80